MSGRSYGMRSPTLVIFVASKCRVTFMESFSDVCSGFSEGVLRLKQGIILTWLVNELSLHSSIFSSRKRSGQMRMPISQLQILTSPWVLAPAPHAWVERLADVIIAQSMLSMSESENRM
ncbi:hypothetical protein H113_03548 [Trichophyton rubrum MR1459]|uniref:Uncharacterized protein n=1 Tax=Trichophyton rubrum (strain ATCC MYA-4607 / CBS 118892) TaxID=559305 RepID=A0A080WLR5_TRIRC|nr:uncharacterized protein TERG_12197 [Trichophyton rubrum CBS 118892]EZF96194.1 hypothetical protein H113_03548 [Trichophyton rubrum MR1459]EZG07219.1 hypothetical protein H106_03336 [Trichophyton rubrum CBS 735.88]KFL61757.1 hypothetical protein TERG_12197 [Trichophyton rubrum CBS 118892]